MSDPRRPGAGPASLDDLAREVVTLAVSRGVTLGTAESLTAGLVCATLGAVPGVSAVLRGAVVAYTWETKQALLGVEPEMLHAVGAVSEQVAAQMVAGARRALGADLAVSTTGVAGPGPSEGVPAGTVYLAVQDVRGGDAQVCRLELDGDRQQVREAATVTALELLFTRLSEWERNPDHVR